MKLQTTLEFVILLSAVASFGVFAISAYSGLLRQQRSAYASVINRSADVNVPADVPSEANSTIFLYASMPNVSYVNKSNALQIVVALQRASALLNLKAIGSQQYGITPSTYSNISVSGTEILPFSVVPTEQGPLNVSVGIEYANGTFIRNLTAESFAVLQGQNQTTQSGYSFSASINRRNESVLYGISNASPIYTVSIWSHCSFIDIYGHQLPIKDQCGGANWYLFVHNNYCYWNYYSPALTYCVELFPTNTSVRQVQASQSYEYNITLSLWNRSETLSSEIGNTNKISTVVGAGGTSCGTASVESVSGTGPQDYENYVVVNTTKGRWQTNMSNYNAYQQALNNLVSVMNYYNNTNGNVDAANEAVNALNSTALRFITSGHTTSDDNCNLVVQGSGLRYSCKPLSVLYYSIDAILNHSGAAHQLISVQGSTVNVT